MLAWLRSPRGSTVTATAVVVILALLWFAPWSDPLPTLPGLPIGAGMPVTPAPGPSAMVSPPANTPAPTVTAPAPAPVASSSPDQSTAGPSGPGVADGASTPAGPPALAPSFDVVRVEPSGATVIAGRGEPGSIVALMDGTQELAHVTVDGSGQFALLPPDLGEGSHYLTLRSGTPAGKGPAGQASLVSKQSVAVAVARAGASKPVVAMLTPDGPARVLSDGAPLGALAGPAPTKPVAVAIEAVEAAAGGKFTVSGVARPGSHARVYLNGAFLADVTADPDGRWAVAVQKGMRPGQYVIRADELAGTGGAVDHRAEVPFTYPAVMAEGTGKDLMTHAASAPPALPVPGAMTASAGTSRTDATSMKAATAPARTAPVPNAGSGRTTAGQPAGQAGVAQSTGTQGQPAAPATAPDRVASATAAGLPDEAGPVTATIVSDLRTATVSRGDSLWRISKRMLGRGLNYTAIYASNASQIRDPALIYPGQVFVVPNEPPK